MKLSYIQSRGESVGENAIPGALNSIDEPLRIGQDCDRPNNVFHGMIDEVRLWNRALSSDDINTLKDLNTQTTPVDPLNKLSTTWETLKSFTLESLLINRNAPVGKPLEHFYSSSSK